MEEVAALAGLAEGWDHQRGRLAKEFMVETITFLLITSGIPIKVVLEAVEAAAASKISENPAVKPGMWPMSRLHVNKQTGPLDERTGPMELILSVANGHELSGTGTIGHARLKFFGHGHNRAMPVSNFSGTGISHRATGI